MAVISNRLDVLGLLAQRTRCGLEFDRLIDNQKSKVYAMGAESVVLSWQGHHRAPEITPWTVPWSNGKHCIAVSLKPSPGAWSFARCFFDRLAPSLAQAFISAAFQPFFDTLGQGPWVANSVMPVELAPGGAKVIAANAAQSRTFDLEFVFSSAAAASAVTQSFEQPKESVGSTDISVPCELHVGRLRLNPDRIQKLRVGDVLLGGVRAVCNPDATRTPMPLLARLRGGCLKRPLAVLQHQCGQWKVVDTHPVFLLGTAVEDDDFFPDQAQETIGQNALGAPDKQWDLGDVRVSVDILAARLSLTVAAIQALRQGDVLEIPHVLSDSHIEIRAGGRRFASGALIALEGRLAVQITGIDRALPVRGPSERS